MDVNKRLEVLIEMQEPLKVKINHCVNVCGYTTGGTHSNALHRYFQCVPLIDIRAAANE